MNSDEETKKINALLIVEVIGKPAEHLTETLNEIVKKIGDEKGIKILDKKVNEPSLMKDQKDFYTSFAEIEVEADEVINIVILMFKYMPAHIEILSPEMISLKNIGWNDILNELTRRLHGYDEVARIAQTEKIILEKKLKELLNSQEQKSKDR